MATRAKLGVHLAGKVFGLLGRLDLLPSVAFASRGGVWPAWMLSAGDRQPAGLRRPALTVQVVVQAVGPSSQSQCLCVLAKAGLTAVEQIRPTVAGGTI